MTKDTIESFVLDYEVCPCMTHTLGEIIKAVSEGHDTIEVLM
jgi:NAD(P)H-nitrite reductase large subunit